MKRPISHRCAAWAAACILGAFSAGGPVRGAGFVQPEEMKAKDQWVKSHLLDGESPPLSFSFLYNGQASGELLKAWTRRSETEKLDDARTQQTITWTDPKTGLQVRCTAVEYADYPTVEWTLYFKNTGEKDTPILSEIQSVDILLDRPPGPSAPPTEFLLYHQMGAPATALDYQPFETPLTPGVDKRITTAGGRPTNSDLPYFNVRQGEKEGMIVVVGWSGQWAARFTRDQENHLRIRGGQELTHFKLLPGEEVRSPMTVLQFWKGDRLHAQNVWRRWMLAHNVPRPGGKPIEPFMNICNGNHYPGIITNAAEELHFMKRYLEEGIKPDYWWEDAGWYPCDPDGWGKTGTWEVEPKRWPKGIREVSDWCRAQGIKTIVWFEPERVAAGTWLAQNRPEWIFGGKNGGLLNLGDSKCRAWLAGHIDKLMTDQGIDLYRQDYNIDPLSYWRGADAEDRQGIAEIRYVEGYLAYWDELLRRRPGMLIDSCASGGRRNDLETLRRALPLLRSDYIFDPVGEQNHTYGIALWMPFYGTGFMTLDAYLVRSLMSPSFSIGVDARRKDLDYDLLRKLIRQWKQIAPCYLGDYYPLTNYSPANDVWMAWQFDRPERGDGVVQAFRRAESIYESARLRLHALEPDAVYVLTNLDETGSTEMTGRELSDKGWLIPIKQRPGAVVLTYKKKP
jgi:alpha-galactosidase